MLRSPTHIVGHGPTSNSTTATTAAATSASSQNSASGSGSTSHHHLHNHHNHHHQHQNHFHLNNNNHNNKNSKNYNSSSNNNNGHVNGAVTHNNTTTANTLNTTAINGSATKSSSGNSSLNSTQHSNHSTSTTATTSSATTTTTRSSLFDSCHRKIRLIGGGPVAFLGGLVAKARRKERDGDQSSTDTKLYLEESVLERKLPDADLKALVDLPAGLDYNEWLASHTLALFEHVNLVYGTISEFCTTSGCPDMTGPGNRTYLWFDEKGKKTRVAAPQYIDYVMTFTQKTVSDESIFPTKYANEFPSSFESIARKILRLQFHVIAHLYASHFREIALLGLHTHLNLTFAHLTALHRRFNLIDEKETDVLRDLEVALRLTDDGSSTTTTTTTSTTTTNTSSSSASNTNNATNLTMTTGTTTNFTNNSGDTSGTGLSSLLAMSGNEDGSSIYQQHHHQHYHNSNSNNSTTTTTTMTTTTTTAVTLAANSATKIDGDASVQPICTQPEAMKSLSNDQSDIRGGAGGGGGGGGVYGVGGGGGNINVLGSYCSNNSGLNSSHIGGIMNFNNNNQISTHPLTPGNLIQCNTSSTSSSSNSHTTTTA